ncbi:MAG TPA: ROK family protein [Tepidisphaeraceae bacterium]|nr:ROK family protein [Tepidisphaeraceae bacterium]
MGERARTYLGVEVGGTKLQIVAADSSGRVIARWRQAADRAGGGRAIARQIAAGVELVAAETGPLAVGVGFGGPVDWKAGRICRSHQIEGWEDFPIGQWLTEHSGLPVVVENDSNCAALAEATLGAGAGLDPVFYFNLGSGVGGGIVIGGDVYHGLAPGEAEFGHLRLDRTGATVESRCSGWAVDQRIRALSGAQPEGVLAGLIGTNPGGESRHLAEGIEKRDPLARQVIDELADDLAFALSHAVHLMHPAVIVMGGGLSLIGEPLRHAIAEALPKYVMEAFLPAMPLRLAKLAEDAVPIGAALLAGSGRMQNAK